MFPTTNTTPATETETKPYTEVTIDPLGRALIEGKNFTGSACSLMGDALKRALGGDGDTSPKPEFYQTDAQNQEQGW